MDFWAIALRLAGIGWYVALCVVIGIVGGLWLDHLAGTLPLFTILGVLLGTVAAFYGVYKLVQPLMQAMNTKGDQSDEGKT
jgi:F0F1-type ATP synthase assembly protein I